MTGHTGGRVGWSSTMPAFVIASSKEITAMLEAFIYDPGESQIRAWKSSIPMLQEKFEDVNHKEKDKFATLLEYELPREGGRRPDVIVLENGSVVVLELKGRLDPTLVDIDQVAAYARDLRHYHPECHNRMVIPVLVPTRKTGESYVVDGVNIVGPNQIGALLSEIAAKNPGDSLDPEAFVRADWEPMPSLVQAARTLWKTNKLPQIRRAQAATRPTLEAAKDIIFKARETQTRRLILITGVPGSGKTLVGLRLAYDESWTELAEARKDGSRPSTTSVLLSGNGPLIEVLRHALKSGVFVQDIMKYIKNYCNPGSVHKIPREHVVIFDEAQRAWDVEKVETKHKGLTGSECNLLVELTERVPEWGVLIGLIGTGQSIHDGEEGGIDQWVQAINAAPNPEQWVIHCPPSIAETFRQGGVMCEENTALSLNVTLRTHFAETLHDYVDNLLGESLIEQDEKTGLYAGENLNTQAKELRETGFRMYITRDLEIARQHVRERYTNEPHARYGIIASSRDKVLPQWGILNDWNSTKRVRIGPWFNENPNNEDSCCQLRQCVTEFQCQGLELDMAIVGWGTDFILENAKWTNQLARGYRRAPKDAFVLRRNSYRVLLTRGRDGMILFVPPIDRLNETYQFLLSCGFKTLD